MRTHWYSLFLLLVLTPLLIADTEGQQLNNARPQNVEIAWDIHGVIMYQPWSAIHNNFEYRELFSLFPPAAKGALLSLFDDGLTTPEQQLLSKAFGLVRAKDISGEGFYWLFKEYGKENLAQMVKQLANAYCPKPGIPEIIKELHQLGYTQRIASNIGSEFYKNLKQKYPALFKYFKGGKTVQYVYPRFIDFNPVRKPNPEYARQYEKQNPGHRKKIIFIDDRIANIEGLRDPNWITLRFRNPHELREDLIKLGIPLKAYTTPCPLSLYTS